MRTIVIGDVHGCLDELDELVRTLEIQKSDRVISVGDMIDRGPDPVGVVRRVRENGWEAVIGNHEDRAIKWLRNESMRRDAGRPNNMRPPFEPRRLEWESLSGEDIGWLWRLPSSISFGSWTVVHAGIEPCLPLAKQDYDQLLRIRYVDSHGRHVTPDPEKLFAQPEGSRRWAEAWGGPQSVIYGHSVFESVQVDEPSLGVRCLGIDTGCVYGKLLTAAVIEDPISTSVHLVQVKATREYFSYALRREG